MRHNLRNTPCDLSPIDGNVNRCERCPESILQRHKIAARDVTSVLHFVFAVYNGKPTQYIRENATPNFTKPIPLGRGIATATPNPHSHRNPPQL